MNELKPESSEAIIDRNSQEYAPLSPEDIQLIKTKFSKKRKVVYYCMTVFLVIGALVSTYAIINYGAGYRLLENLIPFFVGIGLALICLLVLFNYNQEINLELKNSRKCIYKGVVTKRFEKSVQTGTGKNKNTNYYYYIYLGDICIEHKDLYFELSVGDKIEVHISEKLGIIFYKNIIKNKAVADAMPEVIDTHGPLLEIKYKQEVNHRIEFLNDDEITGLKAQKKRRTKRILIVGAIITLLMGATAELNLYIDSYWWNEIIMWRLGFWGIPLAFFSLLFYRRTIPLSKDIMEGKKIIISEKLINKEESYSDAAKAYTYNIKGIRENLAVSKEFFDSIGPGDDFEIHQTSVRNKLLSVVILKSSFSYKNHEIFKSR